MATCDVQALVNEARCFAAIPPGFLPLIELQLLCEILTAGGTGGGSDACLIYVDDVPVDSCLKSFGLAINDNAASPNAGRVWWWSVSTSAWQPIIL